MRPLHLLSTASFFLLVGGCCSAKVNIVPKSAGEAEAVATSSKEGCALEKAQEKAAEHCKASGKTYVAIKQDSVYQGADPTAKMAMGAVFNTNTNTSQDYKVTLQFRCQ